MYIFSRRIKTLILVKVKKNLLLLLLPAKEIIPLLLFARAGRGRARNLSGDVASRELPSRTIVDSLIAPASRDYRESEGFLNCVLVW